jgi:hypothetical protein
MTNPNEPEESEQPEQAGDSEQSDELREQARERVREMPAESALGHRDPQGGGEGEPADYEGDQN